MFDSEECEGIGRQMSITFFRQVDKDKKSRDYLEEAKKSFDVVLMILSESKNFDYESCRLYHFCSFILDGFIERLKKEEVIHPRPTNRSL